MKIDMSHEGSALKSTGIIDTDGNLIMKYEQDSKTATDHFKKIAENTDNGYVSEEKEMKYVGFIPAIVANQWLIEWYQNNGNIQMPPEEWEKKVRLFFSDNNYLTLGN